MTRPIIIGAGINGLVAAADLAIRGKNPLVLERLDRPGGAVRTEELTLPGFHHDVGAMNLSLFAGSAFMAAHGGRLAKHGFELVPIAAPFAQVSGPQTWLGVTTDRQALLAHLNEADRAAWLALVDGFGPRADLLGGLLSGPMSLPALTRWLWRGWRKLGTGGLIALIQLLLSTPRAFLDATFQDETLKTALASWGMHLDFSPDAAGGAIFPYLEGMAGSAMGMVIGKGGAGRLTAALIALIEEQGGTVLCGQEVTAITHDAGRVTGVVAGETHATDRVLATLAPKHLARLLGQTADPAFDAGLRAFTHAPGTLMIHLALDGPIPWAQAKLAQFAYVHIGRSMDEMSMVHAQARAGLLPERPVLVVGQPSLFDPTRALEGKHTAWIQARMVPGEIKGDAAGQITATDWETVAPAYGDRVLAMIGEHAPDLANRIIARRVVSPLDLEAENPNLVGGDQICGSHALSQNFLFRTVRGYPDGRTPVKGLRLIGAASWPGAGTGAASGWRAAQDI